MYWHTDEPPWNADLFEVERIVEAKAEELRNHHRAVDHFERALVAEAEVARLREALACPTPEMIAAAWDAWKARHGGKLGPGPSFREAIEAACRAV